MKRLLLLLAIACVGLASCSETLSEDGENGPNNPTEEGNGDKEYTVKFKVDMRVPELMEGVKNPTSELALFLVKFYDNLIANKSVVPNDYTLTFTKGEEVVGEYKGKWGETEISLPNGTYRVTGECIGDFNTASFSFDESITIDKDTSILTLSPHFNCWIFAFDRQAISNAWWCDGEKSVDLNKTDDFFYIFNSSWHPKLPFVLGSVNCNDFHEQIEYPDGNIWHLGLTWQDADKNYPAKVWYYPYPMYFGQLCYCDKDGYTKLINYEIRKDAP